LEVTILEIHSLVSLLVLQVFTIARGWVEHRFSIDGGRALPCPQMVAKVLIVCASLFAINRVGSAVAEIGTEIGIHGEHRRQYIGTLGLCALGR
jgi:hypothetical protein